MVLRLGGSRDTVWNVPEKGSQVYRRLADPAGEICFS